MYLSDRDIKEHFRKGLLKVRVNDSFLEGDALEKFLEERVKGCSIDLTLSDDFKVHKVLGYSVDTDTPEEELFQQISSKNGVFTLNPGKAVLGRTEEYIVFPNDIRGIVDGKSSKGRKRISVHDTASTIHPGFRGCLVLEILNSGDNSYNLKKGERIIQVLFAKLSSPAEKIHSDHGYVGQTKT
jgi:dCTP deaminase